MRQNFESKISSFIPNRQIFPLPFFPPWAFHLSSLTSLAPLAFHALSTKFTMSSTPFPCFTTAKIVGPPSLRHS